MANTVYRAFLEKLGGSDPETYVGTSGDLFFDPSRRKIKISDGSTPGGIYIGEPSSQLLVESVNDLPDPVGDEVILPADKTVIILGDIDLGSDAMRLSSGTLLRGFGGDTITSSNANGVIRATNLGAHVVMREFSVIATGGPALALTGNTNYQLNMFFMGVFGASIGTVTGYDVQAFKDCFFNTVDGIRNAGTTNKIFYSQCPFYGIAANNAAITLDAGLNARRIDIVNNFFKHNANSIPIRAENGYTVDLGRVSGTMIEGPTVALEGLTSADDNWWFFENDLVRNSRVAAQAYLTSPANTAISATNVYTPVISAFTIGDLTQRFDLNANNELVYTGTEPVLATLNAAFTIDPNNNNRVGVKASKNGTTLDYSQTIIEQGAGPGSSPRAGSIVAMVEITTGDRLGISIANLTNNTNIEWLSATYVINAG